MNTPLQQAAKEILGIWDAPEWQNTRIITEVIAELRKALDAELEQAVEPVAWIGDDGELHRDKPHEAYGPEPTPLYRRPPQPQATTPEVPEGYVLVPIEATPAMADAYSKSPCRDLSGLWHEIITAAAQGEKP